MKDLDSNLSTAEYKRIYDFALEEEDVDKIIFYGRAYFVSLRGGEMLPSDRETLQHQVWEIKSRC